ncbi:choline transporter [Colletotrichum lupini]|uniref:Choline transporter n=1 Tax=Colletotrichum lupini TaxID=145971 RepID=A0A9Q8T659_9PEZI|nr:choline transporter [Colletotrichum lupini]UQC88856.1 choline transporter [Colletotrichum lupini]
MKAFLARDRVAESASTSDDETVVAVQDGVRLNAAGYKDQLNRQYGFFGLASMALTVDNAWVALGSSISVSILNSGPPGIIYGLLVAVFYYSLIGLSLSELASSVPTAGGVYHWATIAGGPRWGRVLGFFTGWINFYGWLFSLAALLQISSNVAVSMYAVWNWDTYVSQPFHVFIGYLIILWGCAAFIVFANKYAPYTQQAGTIFVLIGGVVTIIVLAAMPKQHASNHFVWGSFDENNATGWSGGVAFLLGVLNGAFTIGTPDSVTHMAEEMPHPKKDLPKAILLQISLGFVYAFCFAVALSYAITDITALQGGFNSFPLTNIYVQATTSSDGIRNPGAAFGLLFIMLGCTLTCCVGLTLTVSRTYWALARDNAVPLSNVFAQVNERLSCPIWSTLFVCVVATGLGAIPLGSSAAFLALASSFIILTSVSYAIPFAANMLSGRKYFPRGPFHLGKAGYIINGMAVLFIVLFDIMFCFPTMNWSAVILVGTVAITGLWWAVHAVHHYPGPKVMDLYIATEGNLELPRSHFSLSHQFFHIILPPFVHSLLSIFAHTTIRTSFGTMGSSSSKAAQGAARKFPTRAPGAVPPPSTAARAAPAAPPTQPAQAQSRAKTATLKPEDLTSATTTTNPEVTAEFSSRLRQMGIVQPNPTFSSTSTASAGPGPVAGSRPGPSPHADLIQNPGPLFPSTSRNATLGTLEARRRLQQKADAEFDGLGRSSSGGREFLDLKTIIQMHLMRERGHSPAEIEARLDLKAGVVARLGRVGITSPA